MTDGGAAGPAAQVHVSAALVLDPRRRALLVRKHGTERFMQPGGKPEPGESPAAALVREVAEETGLDLPEERLVALGRFTAAAANEHGHQVVADAYLVRLHPGEADQVRCSAEIAELVWVEAGAPPAIPLAPLTEHHLLPLVPTL